MSISGNRLEVNGGAHSNEDVTIDGEKSDFAVITLVEDEVGDNGSSSNSYTESLTPRPFR